MPRPHARSRLLRRVRRTISLSAVGLLALPLIAWSTAVDVVVDGQVLTARTYAATVGEVLSALEVPLGPADRVHPEPDSAILDGQTIAVQRAITVDVRLGGQLNRRVTAPVTSVAGVLTHAGLDVRDAGGLVAPGWTAPIDDGDTIHVTLPRRLTLTIDGGMRRVTTTSSTVRGVLAEQGVELAPGDEVDWDLDATLIQDANVRVSHLTYDEVVDEVTLAHDEQRRETDELLVGATEVAEEGADGLRRDTYRVEVRDGEELSRDLVGSEVVREPQDRVVLVGTREPAPAPAPRSTAAARSRSGGGSGGGSGDEVWDRLARCESGGNWQARGRHHGGLQFHPDTWSAHAPGGYPDVAYEASRDQQIVVGRRVQAAQGWEAWPHCSRQLGLR